MLGLVGDDADRAAAHPRQAGDDRARPAALDVEPLAVVDDPADHARTCRTACGWARAARRAARRPAGRPGRRPARTGGRSSQCDGKYDRYCLMTGDALLVVEPTSMSPTPDLRQCTREPPSSSCVTSSPIAARTRCGPASAIEPRPLHHRHEVGEPGMYAVPAAQGPMSAATCGTTPLITTSSRKRCPSRRTATRPPPGSARRRSRAARRTGSGARARARAGARP